MKVLVLGATGYIGKPIAQAYVRAGHQVYGVTRSAEKAQSLAADEIIPVVTTPSSSWTHLIPLIDLVVDASGDVSPAAFGTTLDNLTSALALAHAAHERLPSLKLTYIFLSGTWCHGDTFRVREGEAEWKDERNARYDDSGLVSWRPALEQTVLSSTVFDGIVVRPGIVYGRGGSLLAPLFEAAWKAGKEGREVFEWAATPGKRWGLVHQDDLAELVLRVGEATPITKRLIFDAVNPFTESVEDVLSSLAILVARSFNISPGVGFHHIYRAPSSPLEKGIDTHVLTRPSLARTLVGWEPRKRGLVDGLGAYYEAWLAGAGASA